MELYFSLDVVGFISPRPPVSYPIIIINYGILSGELTVPRPTSRPSVTESDRNRAMTCHDLSKLGSGVSHHHRYRLLASVANLLQKHGILLLGLFSPFPISQLCHRTRLLKRWTFAGKENSNRVAVWPYRGCDSMSRGSKCLEPDIL